MENTENNDTEEKLDSPEADFVLPEVEEVEDSSADVAIKLYEIGYLLIPGLSEEVLVEKVDELKAKLKELACEVVLDGAPTQIDLAYTMTKIISNKHHKFDKALFGWIKFKGEPSIINDLHTYASRSDAIIRFLITHAFPVQIQKQIPRKRSVQKKTIEEGGKPVDEAQLNKELEEMLTE